MARPSTVDRLPDDVKELIGRLRRNGRTIAEIRDALSKLDVHIPLSTLGRHTQELDELAKELQESLAFSLALQQRVYDDPGAAGATGRMNHQLGQAVMFKFMRGLREKSGTDLDAKELSFVMNALDKLSKVEERTVDMERALRREMAAEQKKKLDSLESDVATGRRTLDFEALREVFAEAYGAA